MQVEQLRDPSLVGKAVAIQQHGDIIASNAAAKQAGVYKRCTPNKARELLKSVGGRVVHVYLAEGNRVSYQPYRNTSKAFVSVIETFKRSHGITVEKASIDEVFILLPRSSDAGASHRHQNADCSQARLHSLCWPQPV